ncbi:phosphoribosylamine--glycine ligase [Vibrio aestuarianus]|uniref:capsular polysaccharide export protein, LipB/KpsS family n=1 Tax=Vibrio aestuarianus TaxID=28171 RepID=UPI00237C7628|nr:phosphoribosylamine--glycine ligase [Vibrio aestuarianus]MDE1231505.1 phosphoribosylamine--glycine ligase [Vibrio aestuarianus]
MEKKYNLLSLDPMYSPLHEKMAEILAKRKYAITSCLSKKVYLPTFELTLATSLISSVKDEIDDDLLQKMSSLSSYHHAYAKKVESRGLTSSELKYMAKFYIGIKAFIKKKQINLVILHNDSRWYHAVAIDICKELEIQYLVTEQGLIRPFTTVIDPQGCNANSQIDFNINSISIPKPKKEHSKFVANSKHDSFKSMLFFLFFLMGFTLERVNGNKTIIRYMHNNYSLKKYSKRILNKVIKKNKYTNKLKIDSALLLLQLENDSQFLLHSSFKSNQEVIDLVASFTDFHKMNLAIKRHPLDDKKYTLAENSYYIEGKVKELAAAADIVLTINSSASVDVLRTSTPLILMGDSIYLRDGVASRIDLEQPTDLMEEAAKNIDLVKREHFINYLYHDYLVKGAGYSYNTDYLNYKLKQILN